MTLKKLLKKVDNWHSICVYNPNEIDNRVYKGQKKEMPEQYEDFIVKSISSDKNGLYIGVKPPKEKKLKPSTHNKDYKKWMRKYVKEHLDEIGLRDGGYAGD